MAEEERKGNAEEVLYRTKIVQFLGRSTPIILQNDNGPCPLLAICNVLLLKNNLNLSMDVSEVSQKKLLSLVAERLLDSNSNVQDKDTEYLENQQQNIADAIDLLPRLATGIDVNLRFNKINDFEFTPECAIFDLLDIGLYHGWIVDPQDMDTASAIGLKSYNTLVAELVAHGTKNYEENGAIEEDSVDFAAATTATLGVPSPSLSRCRSFEDSPVSSSSNQRRKGDIEEEEELMRALKLSNSTAIPLDDHDHPQSETTTAVIPENFEKYDEIDQLATDKMNACVECNDPNLSSEVIQYSQISSGHCLDPPILGETNFISTEKNDNITKDELITDETIPFCFSSGDISIDCYPITDHAHESGEPSILPSSQCDNTHSECEKVDDKSAFLSKSTLLIADSHSSDGVKPLDTLEKVCPNLEESEPIYEGEECILDPGLSIYRSREPMYEGEVVLAELADKGLENACSPRSEVTNIQWELIRNFLESNASQLTIYGLFCLQEGLKERELCVFFRNNHFSTMFKLNGELYLLATDQGYFNQPALVWEKLNEVNGDTVFMTGNFKEFKTDGQVSEHWNEENAMTSTADYLASINRSDQSSDFSSDLQLAIQLQQQEFEHQSPRQSPSDFQQPAVEGLSRLVTGPQAPRSNYSTSKHESKQKEKCIIM